MPAGRLAPMGLARRPRRADQPTRRGAVSRAIGPRTPFAAGNAALAWLLIAFAWGSIGLAWLTWAAAWLAVILAGGRGHVLPFGVGWASALVHGRTERAWPCIPTPLVAVIGGILAAMIVAVAVAVAVVVWRVIARPMLRPGDSVAALSRNRSIRQLEQSQAAEAANRLRPSLPAASSGRLVPSEIGLLLGRLRQPGGHGPDPFTSWEDTVLAFMGPWSGKTTCLGVPYVLSAPGPVVAISVRADLWAATAELRATRGSATWVFARSASPPPGSGGGGTRWPGWPPSRPPTGWPAIVLTVDDNTRRDIWGPAAEELLTSLLLAAAATSRRTVRDAGVMPNDPAGPSTRPWSWSWTRPPTSAASPTCPTCGAAPPRNSSGRPDAGTGSPVRPALRRTGRARPCGRRR